MRNSDAAWNRTRTAPMRVLGSTSAASRQLRPSCTVTVTASRPLAPGANLDTATSQGDRMPPRADVVRDRSAREMQAGHVGQFLRMVGGCRSLDQQVGA